MNEHSSVPSADLPQTPCAGGASGRRYSGLEPSERTQERYQKFIESGTGVFGTVGYSAAKVKTLCQGAGLSERYFYESFESREHLLTVVYAQLSIKLMKHVKSALQDPEATLHEAIRASLGAVVRFMLADPRHARIMLVEVVGVSAELEVKRHEILKEFAGQSMAMLLLLAGVSPEGTVERPAGAVAGAVAGVPPGADAGAGTALERRSEKAAPATVLDFARLTAVSMVGGVNNMLLDAVLEGAAVNVERIVEVSYQLVFNASAGIRKLAAAPF
ncbi:TetR/AcrR family transcriptional regulator [Arthrobacter psychrochitiniphilus]|uniref:TetR/AcrR family transcriptional regulator n=1 Tax=Arthrobacter psychrochitiniphilus TaxID=291045 RepID=UPI0011B5B2C3|nr:TetR/AcrR family transcriptional regulator [Arthrobacter psychrochitiniphilus]NYG16357.1 AcrR family transcriptional regulator [Arthrobacter psychrochitiniphilus]